jgi:hypothetical protein
MTRIASVAVIGVLVVAGCFGDLKFEETSTLPTAPPPGSTVNMGSVSANVNGEQFFARLSTGATYRDSRLTFSAYDGYTRQISISARLPGPGTYEIGAINSPSVSFLESEGTDTKRWFAASGTGAGSITVSFLSPDAAIGTFSFHLLPDSATAAAGVTGPRNVTSGTFNVNVSR